MFKNLSNKAQGAIYMLIACIFASILVSIVKHLADQIHSTVIVFMRNLFSLIFFVPFLLKDYKKILGTKKIFHHFCRGANGSIVIMCWFYTISILPLSTAVAINFLTPILTTIAAHWFLKEKVNNNIYFACLISFVGVIVILQPDFNKSIFIYAIPFLSVLLWVVSNLIIKTMTKTEKPQTIVAYMSIFMLIFSVPFAIPHMQPISFINLFWLIILGFTSNLSHIYVAKAYSKTDLSILQPLDFSRLIFVSIIAFIFFDEKPTLNIFVGSGIILLALLLISKKKQNLQGN